YCTLYGDMVGGLAVISDVPETMVYRLARWVNRHGARIPVESIEKPPSAELRPDQKDSDSLPPYEILDPILEAYVEDSRSISEIVAMGFEEATVRRVSGLVRRSEYKRRQAPPGPKVTRCAFGRERRYPITAVYGDT
ncbi:MAG: NAD(+) synthase, partial [Panacagrimonas sp.]